MGKAHKMRKVGAVGLMPWQNPVIRLERGDGVSKLAAPVAVGSTLLQRLAAQTWHEVTEGKGVTLVDGKPVPVKGGKP